jgi:hypothetical protein
MFLDIYNEDFPKNKNIIFGDTIFNGNFYADIDLLNNISFDKRFLKFSDYFESFNGWN